MKTQCLELVPVYCQLSCASPRAPCKEMRIRRMRSQKTGFVEGRFYPPLFGFGRGKTMDWRDYIPPLLSPFKRKGLVF